MEAQPRTRSRSIAARIGALCLIALPCASVSAATVDDAERAVAEINAQVDQLVVQASILSELLRIREAAGEMNPAAHQQNIGAAVSQMRSSPETMPIAMLKRERVVAAQRLMSVAESQIALARWPSDRPGSYYVQLARLAMEDARTQLAYLSGLDASLVEAARRAAEVIGWTQGRLGGGNFFDGLDEEIDAMTKAVVTDLPRPPMPSSTVAAAPGAAASAPSPSPTQAASTATPPTPSARSARVATFADPMTRGYRIDRCLHWAQQCDEPAATAWCRTQGYQLATNWQWRPARPTLVTGDNVLCDADYCGAFTTITCADRPAGTATAGAGSAVAPPQPATTTSGAAPTARPPQTAQPGTQGAVPIQGHPGFGPWQFGAEILDGAGYGSVPIPTAEPALCLAECARDPRCRGVIFTMPGGFGVAQATCWLKAQPGRFAPHPSAMSAVKLATAAAGGAPPSVVTPPVVTPPVATPPVATPPVATPPVAPRPPLAQCDIGGQWRMDTQNVGQSTWTFSPLGGNRYSAQESGLGSATGTAAVNGNSLRLEWRTGSYSGVVELTLDATCRSAQGRQVFHTPQPGVQPSTWTRIGAAPPPPVAKPPPAVTPPPVATPGALTGRWNGPSGIYEFTHTGNSFTWRVGSEVGQGTISGENLQVTWTGGGSATGRMVRNPQGLPIEIAWSNGVVMKRVGF